MHIVDAIFERLGEATAIAGEMNLAVQTVHSWKTGGNIPSWRRRDVIDAARRMGKDLEADMVAYLASNRRAPKKDEAAKSAQAA